MGLTWIYTSYTGSEIFDASVTTLLSTSMFVGGFIGFFLDNTIPGKVIEDFLLQRSLSMKCDFIFLIILSHSTCFHCLVLILCGVVIIGTKKERGIALWLKMRDLQGIDECTDQLERRLEDVYGIPFISEFIKRHKVIQIVLCIFLIFVYKCGNALNRGWCFNHFIGWKVWCT